MTNSVNPDQTAPIGPTLFASILKLVCNVRQLFAADDFSRRHYSDAFFLGALMVKINGFTNCMENIVDPDQLASELDILFSKYDVLRFSRTMVNICWYTCCFYMFYGMLVFIVGVLVFVFFFLLNVGLCNINLRNDFYRFIGNRKPKSRVVFSC